MNAKGFDLLKYVILEQGAEINLFAGPDGCMHEFGDCSDVADEVAEYITEATEVVHVFDPETLMIRPEA